MGVGGLQNALRCEGGYPLSQFPRFAGSSLRSPRGWGGGRGQGSGGLRNKERAAVGVNERTLHAVILSP